VCAHKRKKKPLFDFYCFQCDFQILFGSYFQSFPTTTTTAPMFLYAKPLFLFEHVLSGVAGKALVSKCLYDYCHFYIKAIELSICLHKREIKGFTENVFD